jgi:hypothetical protein
VSWSRKLPQPVRLRDGRELITLSDARALILGLAEGNADKIEGKVQNAVGGLKDTFKRK